MGRAAYDKPTPENAIVLLIDRQIGLTADIRGFRSLAEWQNGDTLPKYGFILENF